jgi:hypothetical protein
VKYRVKAAHNSALFSYLHIHRITCAMSAIHGQISRIAHYTSSTIPVQNSKAPGSTAQGPFIWRHLGYVAFPPGTGGASAVGTHFYLLNLDTNAGTVETTHSISTTIVSGSTS